VTNAARRVLGSACMDEKDFKKHLQDLAHGHHHPEEHDWVDGAAKPEPVKASKPPAKAKKRVKAT